MAHDANGYPVVDLLQPHGPLGDGWYERLQDAPSTAKRLETANLLAEEVLGASDGETGFCTVNTALAAMSGVARARNLFAPLGSASELPWPSRSEKLWTAGLVAARHIVTARGEPYTNGGAYTDTGLIIPFIGVDEREAVVAIHRLHLVDANYYSADVVFNGLRRSLAPEAEPVAIAREHVSILSRQVNTLVPSGLSGYGPHYAIGLEEVRAWHAQWYLQALNSRSSDTLCKPLRVTDAMLDEHIAALREGRHNGGYDAGVPVDSYTAELHDPYARVNRRASLHLPVRQK